jgi:hypothetical protein
LVKTSYFEAFWKLEHNESIFGDLLRAMHAF